MYVFTRCGIHIRQKGSRARGALATALNTLALGLAVLVVASVARLVRVAAVVISGAPLLTLNAAIFWVNNLGYIIVAVGLSIAGFAQGVAASRWRRRRRHQYRALAPLWSALIEAFPEISLSNVSSSLDASDPTRRFGIVSSDGSLRFRTDYSASVVETPNFSGSTFRRGSGLDR